MDWGDEANFGREWRVSPSCGANMTARNTKWFYVTRRRGDPLIHACSSASSRTICGRSVVDLDRVDPGDVRQLTCLACVGAPFYRYRGEPLTSDGFLL